jgi:diacylglycerol kinase family enzyme
MRLCVVLNASAGSLIGAGVDKTKARIEAGFSAPGNSVDVRTPEGDQLEATLKEAAGQDFDAIIVGGGDGTIATAAAICAKADVPLGVLPLGTMNMLAKDLQIPLDLEKAIEALGRGEVRAIDMGEVNGEIFLCNSTLGLVPMVGRERENQRGKNWASTITGMSRALLRTLWQFPGWTLMLEYDGHRHPAVTRLLTIANNAYESGGFMRRSVLDAGHLTIYVSRHRSRLGLLWFSLGLMLHFWQHDHRLETVTTSAVTVTRRHKKTIHVSNDGEIKKLTVPLVYRILPGALKVLAPAVPGVEGVVERAKVVP